MPCPVCGLPNGFHDEKKHAEHEIPRHLLKESGWAKEAYKEMIRERKAAEADAALLAEVLALAEQEVERRLPSEELERRLKEIKEGADNGRQDPSDTVPTVL